MYNLLKCLHMQLCFLLKKHGMCHLALFTIAAQRPIIHESNHRKYSEVETGITTAKVVSSSMEKNYQIDSKINALLKVADARSMYYTQMQNFQDRHFVMLLSRLQQIQDLGGAEVSSKKGQSEVQKRKSIGLLSDKLQEKVLSRIQYMDCEDILILTRYLSKIKLPTTNHTFRQIKSLWVQEVMIKLSQRLQEPELSHEMRQLYTFKQWITLAAQINATFANVILQNQDTLMIPEIKIANEKIGDLLSEEFMRSFLSPGASGSQYGGQKVEELISVLDQLSRFTRSEQGNGEQERVIKGVINRLIGQQMKAEQILTVIHSLTRLENRGTQLQQLVSKLSLQVKFYLKIIETCSICYERSPRRNRIMEAPKTVNSELDSSRCL